MTRMRTNQAIVAAFRDAMLADDAVVLLGEDVATAGGPFKTSEGLLDEFGPSRVRDTPIAEMGFLGAAVGAAALGLRPVVEIMFVEFLGVALDQLVTGAAKFHYLSGGAFKAPLTVRASVGSGLGFGAQHSQTLENWFAATPGLNVVVPSSPQRAYSLLRAAIENDNPVVVLEPRILYGERGEVVTGRGQIAQIGRAFVEVSGTDVTIVASGAMVGVGRAAIDNADWTADLIDLATLVPWDADTVLASVAKTGRLVIVEESPYSGGWGAGVAAHVSSEMFGDLLAPVLRVTCPDVPVPFGKAMEQRFAPNSEYVKAQVDEYLATQRLPRPWWEVAQ